MTPARWIAAAAAWALTLGAPAAPAIAQSASQDGGVAAPQGDAASLFERGEGAFAVGDYLLAARLFEQAHALAPHADASWNAAQSWYRGGDLVRAANLFERYLDEAPADAKDRDRATALMLELSKRLAKIRIMSEGVTELHIDDAPVRGRSAFVTAGQHVIWGRGPRGIVRVVREVQAGEHVSVVLEARSAAAPSTAPRAPAASPTERGPVPRESARPLSPAYAYAGLALTAVAAAAAIGSGVDTLAARNEFDTHPTRGNLDEGRFKQDRTNVLFYTAAGLGVLTAAASLWLVDWKGAGRRFEAAIGPGAAHVRLGF